MRDSGRFYFDRRFEGGFVDIRGENVRLRSQPNTQSRIIAECRDEMWIDGNYTYYLGEWTNPQGERWIVADYEGFKNGKSTPLRPVWIFGKYTELITRKDFEERLSAEAE